MREITFKDEWGKRLFERECPIMPTKGDIILHEPYDLDKIRYRVVRYVFRTHSGDRMDLDHIVLEEKSNAGNSGY